MRRDRQTVHFSGVTARYQGNLATMADRFYIDFPGSERHITLRGSQAHHLARVLRAKPGDAVVLFDGKGAEYEGTVLRVAGDRVDLEIGRRVAVSREAAVPLTIGIALPKGDRQRWLVEKLTELGVSRLVLLVTARSVVQPRANTVERLRRVVIEASKQCGRNQLMEVDGPWSWEQWLAHPLADSVRLIAHPGGSSRADALRHHWSDPPRKAWHVSIGPEGGWTEREVSEALEQGWSPVSFGRRILRVETAAVAVASWLALSEYLRPPDK